MVIQTLDLILIIAYLLGILIIGISRKDNTQTSQEQEYYQHQLM